MSGLIARLLRRAEPLLTNGNGPVAGRRLLERRAGYVVTRAESAPCTCPEFCERDHENE